MNKTAIKNFAIWARKKLISEIIYKAGLMGVTEKGIGNPLPQSTKDVQFFDIGAKEPYSITGAEIEQRRNLVDIIQKKEKQSDYKTAYHSVIEEVAYTWFNRLIAVRFMEVNDFLPSRIRVLSSESSSKIEPDLVTSPFDADLDYTPNEKDRIIQLKNDNKLDELFRMLFIKQCNALNAILPELFQKTNDYTELLMNVSFTDKDSVVYRLVHDIPEDDFNVEKEGQIEIIGWLYQYYNTEPKDETFALLKKNVKITKERIPAATQLFTPDWIVRYMVENSLGRLWLEGHPNDELRAKWKYYLDEAEQEPYVQLQLDAIREEYKDIQPEDIKVIDPCMGSGHILVYAFDVLMQIYESYGYSQRDAAKSILENNLYGLDIDNRAYQLAYFAVMMKARQYNRRILDGKTNCHLYEIQESNGINRTQLKYFGYGMSDRERNTALNHMEYLLDAMRDAKEYGSILNVSDLDWKLLYQFTDKMNTDGQLTLDTVGLDDTQKQLCQLVEIAAVIAQKYDVVITNPPYMGNNGMGEKLSGYVKKNYPNSKSDLFSVFIEKCSKLTQASGYYAMITQPSFLFLSSFEKLRKSIITQNTITSLLHMGRGIFGIDFGSASFVIHKHNLTNYIGSFFKLHERTFQYLAPEDIEQLYLLSKQDDTIKYDFSDYETKTGIMDRAIVKSGIQLHYAAKQENFTKIPGTPVAYWVSQEVLNSFGKQTVGTHIVTREGMATADNERFLRFWFEVDLQHIKFDCSSIADSVSSAKRWFPYNKGGDYRKWYGNNDYVVDWLDDGKGIKNNIDEKTGRIRSHNYNGEYSFRYGITWSSISAGDISVRWVEQGFLFDSKGAKGFCSNRNHLAAIQGLLNSIVSKEFLKFLSPTMDFKVGDIIQIPLLEQVLINERILELVNANIFISKMEWDSFETSWDFLRHPFIDNISSEIEDAYATWQRNTDKWFEQLKKNEEELNRIFIDIYGLQDELIPDVEDKDVSVRKADLGRDIRSFLSYAVGCMFGRYSLDVDGLTYAGGEWDDSKYSTFNPDEDNVIPITDEQYFEDDIVGLFCAFLKKTFGSDTLEENLDFIAQALGNKGNTSREVIRNYFLKDFFKDHCKVYQKRPIYWLFDSGKENGFKALIYMHSYNEDTIGNLRIDYLHRMQRVYESEIARMQDMIDNSNNAREIAAATKRKEKLTRQLKETKEYDEKIAHLALVRIPIDLDDGVKVNYDKVQTGTDGKKLDVLAKI